MSVHHSEKMRDIIYDVHRMVNEERHKRGKPPYDFKQKDIPPLNVVLGVINMDSQETKEPKEQHKLCLCGCGLRVHPSRFYHHGHKPKTKAANTEISNTAKVIAKQEGVEITTTEQALKHENTLLKIQVFALQNKLRTIKEVIIL